MRHDTRYETLDSLDKYELEHKSQDIRGRPLVSPSGEKYGVIKDLLVDNDRSRVAAVRLDNGKVCAIEPLEIHENAVVYGGTAEAHARDGGAAVDEERVPLVEEKLVIGKRAADTDRTFNVRTRVAGETVNEDVTLRDENVSIDRRPVDRRVTGADAEALLNQGDRTISMTERHEELVVGKEARVAEELVVRKTADDRVEHVSETVRKTEVDVDTDTTRDRR
ncbi:YsnF/AvaK domain-containing protein [Porphyrobacter sp. GA68]|uniref:YsnF/AvaK domain-containing protein n=1 Tax=Porphyrobacter sp. GA68 TaxID=2883480 RepID=UPI001D188121|nr:YsnF/AvaK domain-containing protein [Porphyrobacter sp. GA68]